MKLSIINLKGGTGKTTSAIFTSLGLNRDGKTLLIDADPQGSALSWSESSKDFPVTVVGLPVKDIHKRITKFEDDYKHIVIDTPPGDIAIVRSSLLKVDMAIIPISQGLLDIDRLRPTLDLLEEVQDFNEDLKTCVLLTRTRKGTKSPERVRSIIRDDLHLDMFDTEISLREIYGTALGEAPSELGEYEEVVKQILKGRTHGNEDS